MPDQCRADGSRACASSAALFALLTLSGCPEALVSPDEGDTDGIGLSVGTGGTRGGGESDGDSRPTSASATSTDSSSDTDDSSGASESGDSGSSGGCLGEMNDCGGCRPPAQMLGTPCNACENLTWQCDGADEVQCDGFDPAAESFWPDADGDGFGDGSASAQKTCDGAPEGWVPNDQDCNDENDAVHPDATEVCNGLDDQCSGGVDEGPTEFCDDVCCSFELACDGVACAPKCDQGDICGENLDECCDASEVCFANSCVVPGTSCEFTEECPVGDICAQSIGQCVPGEVAPECEFVPPVGDFEPRSADNGRSLIRA